MPRVLSSARPAVAVRGSRVVQGRVAREEPARDANHAMAKLGARDRVQLVVFAYQANLPGAHLPGRLAATRRH
jgi:hypothetical protein